MTDSIVPSNERPDVDGNLTFTQIECEDGTLGSQNLEMTSAPTADQETSLASDEEEEDDNVEVVVSNTGDSREAPNYKDGVIALASIVARRLRETHPGLLGDPSTSQPRELPSWLQAHASTDTAEPSQQFVEQALKMDSIFIQQHGVKVDKAVGVTQRFNDHVADKFPELDR